MKRFVYSLFTLMLFVLAACSGTTQTLQEYYVNKTESEHFLSMDVPTFILGSGDLELTAEEKQDFEAIQKINILAFNRTPDNEADFVTEKAEVQQILAASDYEELLKMNAEWGNASIRYTGKGEAIDEVIIFADRKEEGFVLVRVLGSDMNPTHFGKLFQLLDSAPMPEQETERWDGFFKVEEEK